MIKKVKNTVSWTYVIIDVNINPVGGGGGRGGWVILHLPLPAVSFHFINKKR